MPVQHTATPLPVWLPGDAIGRAAKNDSGALIPVAQEEDQVLGSFASLIQTWHLWPLGE